MVEQTDHTITVKQSSSKMSTTYSKRDVANSTELTKKLKVPKRKWQKVEMCQKQVNSQEKRKAKAKKTGN